MDGINSKRENILPVRQRSLQQNLPGYLQFATTQSLGEASGAVVLSTNNVEGMVSLSRGMVIASVPYFLITSMSAALIVLLVLIPEF